MKLTVKQLRRLIREFGVDDTNRNDAGFFMAGGAHSSHRDREALLVNPPPGLGGPEEQEEDGEEDDVEKKSQWTLRVDDRRGGPGRQA